MSMFAVKVIIAVCDASIVGCTLYITAMKADDDGDICRLFIGCCI